MRAIEQFSHYHMPDLPFFNGIQTAELDILIKASSIKKYPKRTSLFLQGDKLWKFFIIIKGWVKLYNITEDGKEILIGMLTNGDTIGDAQAFDSSAHLFSAIAAEETELIEIPTGVMRERVMANPALAQKIVASITRKIHALRVANSHLTSMNAQQRLSCLLLRLSANMKGKGGTLSLPYDKSLIAGQLGIDPATLSRALTRLEKKEVTNKGVEIHIKDFSKLSSFCCKQCPIPRGQCLGRRDTYDNNKTDIKKS